MKHLRKMAAAGRGGDNTIGHLTTGEIVIPKSAQTPDLMRLLAAALAGTGHDMGRYTVGGDDDSRNPKTGAREFYDGGDGAGGAETGGDNSGGWGGDTGGGYGGGTSDPMGSAADYGMAGPVGPADPMGTGQDYTPSAGWSAPDVTGMGRGENEALLSGYGWGGRKVGAMMDNPIATALNFAASFTPVGALNIISGLVGGPTVGSVGTAMGRAAGNAMGMNGPAAPETQVAGSVEGKTTGAMNGPEGGPETRDGGDVQNTASAMPWGPSGGASSPLASALLGVTPSNQNGGRMSYGSLVNSYSPFGRQYVTPWAYRG